MTRYGLFIRPFSVSWICKWSTTHSHTSASRQLLPFSKLLPHVGSQGLGYVGDFVLCPWTPGFSVLHHLPELAQTHVHWVGDAIQPSCPLSSPSPPAFSLSPTRVISSESVLHLRWPKYWSFSLSISPSNEYSRLFSFTIDLFDFLPIQGTLKSLLQHHSSKASILRCSVLYSPTLTSIHAYWKNHSFDYTDLFWQSNISAF